MSEKDKYNVLNSIKRNEKIPQDRDTKEILIYFERNGYIKKLSLATFEDNTKEISYQITEKGREYMDEF
jgi:hypothetical protein